MINKVQLNTEASIGLSNVAEQNTNAGSIFNGQQVANFQQRRSANEIANDIIDTLGQGDTSQKGISAILEINSGNVKQIWNSYRNYKKRNPNSSNNDLASSIWYWYDTKTSKKLLHHIVNVTQEAAKKQNVDISQDLKAFNEAIDRDVSGFFGYFRRSAKQRDIAQSIINMMNTLKY